MTQIRRIALTAVAASVLSALPADAASAASCNVKGTTVVDQTKYVQIHSAAVKNPVQVQRLYYACRLKTGKRYRLAGDECFNNDIGAFTKYDIAGNKVAYGRSDCDLTVGFTQLQILDVTTGVKTPAGPITDPLPGPDEVDISLADVVVNGKGDVAWIGLVDSSDGPTKRYDVFKRAGTTRTLLDSGAGVVGDSLALSGNLLFWLKDGAPRGGVPLT